MEKASCFFDHGSTDIGQGIFCLYFHVIVAVCCTSLEYGCQANASRLEDSRNCTVSIPWIIIVVAYGTPRMMSPYCHSSIRQEHCANTSRDHGPVNGMGAGNKTRV